MQRALGWLAAALAATTWGCQTPSPTTHAVSQAELAVEEAAASDAARLAPDELRLAQTKLALAEEAVAEGDHERARRLAEQALVDAQLAELRAESEAAVEDARAIEGRIGTFQRSLPLAPEAGDPAFRDVDGDGIVDPLELDH